MVILQDSGRMNGHLGRYWQTLRETCKKPIRNRLGDTLKIFTFFQNFETKVTPSNKTLTGVTNVRFLRNMNDKKFKLVFLIIFKKIGR